MISLLEFMNADNYNSTIATSEEPFSNELQRWFNHQPMNMNQSSRDACQWFQVNKNLYPRIEIMARDHVGITATSVPSKCAFSAAGCIVSKYSSRSGSTCSSPIGFTVELTIYSVRLDCIVKT